jgi:type II/IV secretion system protein
MGTGWLAGGAPGGRRRLGEVLVAGKVLTDAQLNEALRVQREDKGRRRRLGEVITALGLADEVAIARALSDQLGLPFLVGLTFAGGLRTILRQDPDIVMVGEIRDPRPPPSPCRRR